MVPKDDPTVVIWQWQKRGRYPLWHWMVGTGAHEFLGGPRAFEHHGRFEHFHPLLRVLVSYPYYP